MKEAKVRAPKLPSDPALWLNTGGKALLPADLKGRVVLLEFWTYCCIHCLHVLPDLKYLEAKYAGRPLLVIGVHSGKFDNEKNAENVRNALLRHDIRHPVVRDDDYKIWREYEVHAWPTFVLVDPQGYYLGSLSGEGHRAQLDTIVGQLLDSYGSEGLTVEHAPAFTPELERETDPPLSYPGKVFADEAGRRLFIADTRHNRLVVSDLDGNDPFTIGSGQKGRADGNYAGASFFQPQGMALVGEALYVCDSENHLLRRIDLQEKAVSTVAGTGIQDQVRVPAGSGLETPLSSPWDICYLEECLYLAMAGTHQIWRYEMRSGWTSLLAGNGREARVDGPAREAAFARPGGITTDDRMLFVADSETSSIRAVMLGARPVVSTLTGGDLFEFGDLDGKGEIVRLQYPLGIDAYQGQIYIADTFNHKIKILTLETGEVKTVAGTGKAGFADGVPILSQLREPGGLSIADHKVYIADTNNHCIRILDLAEQSVRTMSFPGLHGTASLSPIGGDNAS